MISNDIDTEKQNARSFILFRIFFTCRLYYPILTVLFLDYGLSLEQYSLLNVAWAVSIVLFEVPSGALADVVGRKRLVLFSALLMIVEMAILVFTPRITSVAFALLLVNRVLSGLAEASASGADESLVYDSLREEGREQKWAALMACTLRYQSVFMVVAMLVGGFLYDWNLLNQLFPALGQFMSRDGGLRLPVVVNLALAIACWFSALGFVEKEAPAKMKVSEIMTTLRLALRNIGSVFTYIFRSPHILFLLLVGLSVDSSIRMFMTLSSQYFRDLSIPESLFGVLGALMALAGFVTAAVGPWAVANLSQRTNLAVVIGLTLASFGGIRWVHSYWAVGFVLLLDIAMFMLGFFLSHYLNQAADSTRRATLLSFRGMTFNMAYGWMGLLYSYISSQSSNNFMSTLPFFYQYFLVMLALVGLLYCFYPKQRLV